jgi:putative ABC transport system substrate-binding protein
MFKQISFLFVVLFCSHFFGCSSLFNSNNHAKKVIILYPISHPSLEKIKEGFKATLNSTNDQKYEFVEYNGSGNRSLMHQQTEQAFALDPTLIFAIASSSAALVTATALKKQATIPLVCGAADIELLKINGELPKCMGVVSDEEDYEKQLNLLKMIRPSLQTIGIVYDQNSSKNETDLKKYLHPLAKKHHLQLLELPVTSTQEMQKKAALFLESNKIDVLMIFKDSMVVSGLEILVKLCNDHHVTLYTSDLDSVARGAAAGFGLEEITTGIESGKLAQQMLADPTKKPDHLLLKSEILLINKKTMHAQGLYIPDSFLKETELGTQFIKEGK